MYSRDAQHRDTIRDSNRDSKTQFVTNCLGSSRIVSSSHNSSRIVSSSHELCRLSPELCLSTHNCVSVHTQFVTQMNGVCTETQFWTQTKALRHSISVSHSCVFHPCNTLMCNSCVVLDSKESTVTQFNSIKLLNCVSVLSFESRT